MWRWWSSVLTRVVYSASMYIFLLSQLSLLAANIFYITYVCLLSCVNLLSMWFIEYPYLVCFMNCMLKVLSCHSLLFNEDLWILLVICLLHHLVSYVTEVNLRCIVLWKYYMILVMLLEVLFEKFFFEKFLTFINLSFIWLL